MLYYSGSGHSSAETAAGKDAGTRMAQLQVGGPKKYLCPVRFLPRAIRSEIALL